MAPSSCGAPPPARQSATTPPLAGNHPAARRRDGQTSTADAKRTLLPRPWAFADRTGPQNRHPAKHLSAAINRSTGQSLPRHVKNLRSKAVQEWLLHGNSAIVAMLSCGFNAKSNFNRESMRITGMSPRQWVQKQQTYDKA
ncbi:MAG: helix-turn-helix transcriptional regulator [Rhodospirillales bacterium]|nr:helix-turn-helix transcriptional regulator [Rhodospirillales bacterium]